MPRKPRRAKLTIEGEVDTGGLVPDKWLRLTYKNGELAMHSELLANPKRARAAILRAMQDVLISEGFTVIPPEKVIE